MKLQFISPLNFQRILGIDDAAFAAIAASVAAAGSQGANAAIQGKTNLKTRQFAEEMYFRQRSDALADWNRQNLYNSPAAQMARYKDAGLNPHLIYGQQSNAPAIRSSEAQPWHPEAPKFDLGAVSGAYFNTKQAIQNYTNAQAMESRIKADTEKLEAQTEYMKTMAIVGEQKARSLGVSIDTAQALQPYQIEGARLMNIKTGQQTTESESRTRLLEAQKAESELRQEGLSIDNMYKISEKEMKLALGQNTLALGAEAILHSKADRLRLAATTAKTWQEKNNLMTQAVVLDRQAQNLQQQGYLLTNDVLRSNQGYNTGDNALNQYLKEFKEKVKTSFGAYDKPEAGQVKSSSGKKYRASAN